MAGSGLESIREVEAILTGSAQLPDRGAGFFASNPPSGPSEHITPTATSDWWVEKEGDRTITSILPPLSENNPAARVLLHHPGSAQVGASNFIITPYESGMGISYDGAGPIQFSALQVAVNGDNKNLSTGLGKAGQLVVSDEYDAGGLFLQARRYKQIGLATWASENYGEIATGKWTDNFQGSLHLKVYDTPRTVTDGQLLSTTEVQSATAAFVATDVGRRIQGVGIPIGAIITNINSASDVTISVAATVTANGVTLTIGRETVDVWTGPVAPGSQAKQLVMGRIGPASESGLMFGALDDTNLFRNGAGALKTTGSIEATTGVLPAGTGLLANGSTCFTDGSSTELAIRGVGGANLLRLGTNTNNLSTLALEGIASAVNRWRMRNSATTVAPELLVEGTDGAIDLRVTPKSTGVLDLNYAVIGLGGGAAPTLGTIGGSGPAAAAQNCWVKIKAAGTATYMPGWR